MNKTQAINSIISSEVWNSALNPYNSLTAQQLETKLFNDDKGFYGNMIFLVLTPMGIIFTIDEDKVSVRLKGSLSSQKTFWEDDDNDPECVSYIAKAMVAAFLLSEGKDM